MNDVRPAETRRRRILLLCEHKLRDLAGLAYLKFILESRFGHDVLLASSANSELLDESFDPDLVVFPHLWNEQSVVRAHSLRQRGVAVAVALTEGHAMLEHEPRGWAYIAGKFTDLSPVDLHFVWSERTRALMLELGTLSDDRISVGGVPRFDFYAEPLRRLHLTREAFCAKYGIDPSRPIVTCATNFAWAPLSGRPADLAAMERKYGTLIPHLREMVVREVASRDMIGETVITLARRLSGTTFVIKMHPAEEPAWYEQLKARAGGSNIVVIQREVIWDVLNSSDVHLHRSCTTGAEAWLMGKPTIDLQLNPNDPYFSPEMSTGGEVARTPEDVTDLVDGFLGGARPTAEQVAARKELIQKWYTAVDGRRTEHCAGRLDVLLRSRSQRRRAVRFSLKATKVHMRRMLGLEHYEPLRRVLSLPERRVSDVRDKFIRTADVRDWVGRVARIVASDGPPGASNDGPFARTR